jgi:phospholipase C
MDYYDGNTVTALWNYAQHHAMNDNSYGTNFGPSSPGAVNVTAGNTFGALCGPASAVWASTPCTVPTGLPQATPGQSAAQGTGTM